MNPFRYKLDVTHDKNLRSKGIESKSVAAASAEEVEKNKEFDEKSNEMQKPITFDRLPGNIEDWIGLSNMKLTNFTEKTHLINDYLETQNFENDILVLPNILSITHSDRFLPFFETRKSFIRMVNRKKIVDKIIGNFLTRQTIFNHVVYGPKGCGKSFIVYQLTARLMQDRRNFVVYINFASDNLIKEILSILSAKLQFESIDVKEVLKRIGEENMYLVENNIDLAIEFIQETNREIDKRQQELIFVIDQINNLDSNKHIKFLMRLKLIYNCIFASSANNSPTDFKIGIGDLISDEELVRFNSNDFRAFCGLLEVELSDYEQEQVMSVTGSIVFYLDEFFRFFYPKVQKKIISFQKSIEEYIIVSNENKFSDVNLESYVLQLTDGVKKRAVENIYHLLHGEEILGNNNYDRRFLYATGSSDSIFKPITPKTLKAVSSLAFNAVVNYYLKVVDNQKTQDDLNDWFIQSMQKDLVAACRGHLTEYFLIESLTKRAQTLFKVHVLGKLRRDRIVDLVMKNYDIVHFCGEKAPPPQELKANTLFVPYIPNYPGFDFFYYDATQRIIYFFQVSIVIDPMTHVNKNDENFNKGGKIKKAIKSWRQEFLPSNVTMIEIWIIQNSMSFKAEKSEKKSELNVIYFDEVKDLSALNFVANDIKINFQDYSKHITKFDDQ